MKQFAQGDGVIGGARRVDSARPGKVRDRSGVGGRPDKALVVLGAEAGEHDIGLRQSGSTGEAKLADQTVLASAPGALDAAFGLGRVGGNLLDAEFFEGASELGRSLFSGELFGESPQGVWLRWKMEWRSR